MYVYGVEYLFSNAVTARTHNHLRQLNFSHLLSSDELYPNLYPEIESFTAYSKNMLSYQEAIDRKYCGRTNLPMIFSKDECQQLDRLLNGQKMHDIQTISRQVDQYLHKLVNKYSKKIIELDVDRNMHTYDYGHYQVDYITKNNVKTDGCNIDETFNFWMDLKHLKIADMIGYLEVLKPQMEKRISFLAKDDLIKYIDQLGTLLYYISNQFKYRWIRRELIIHRDPRQLTRLSGPIKFDYVNVMTKSILFLGEEHTMTHICHSNDVDHYYDTYMS